MTYEESAALMSDIPFRGRVKVAGLKYATYIQNEDVATAAHSARYRWAQQMATQPDLSAQTIQPMVVMDDGVQTAGVDNTGKSNVTDAALQTAVEAVVNKFI